MQNAAAVPSAGPGIDSAAALNYIYNAQRGPQAPGALAPNAPLLGQPNLGEAQEPAPPGATHLISSQSGPQILYTYDPTYLAALVGQPLLAAAQALLREQAQTEGEMVPVNAKQYRAILRRREQRRRAEERGQLVRVRKPFQNKSRHDRAAKRARTTSGKFAPGDAEQPEQPPDQGEPPPSQPGRDVGNVGGPAEGEMAAGGGAARSQQWQQQQQPQEEQPRTGQRQQLPHEEQQQEGGPSVAGKGVGPG